MHTMTSKLFVVFTRKKVYIIFVLIFLKFHSCVTGNTNEVCTLNDPRKTVGICKPLIDCPSVLGLLRAGVSPTSCSARGTAMVCCPNARRISSEKCDEFMKVLTRPIKAKQALSFDGNHNEKKNDDNTIKCETFFIGFISGGRDARRREYPFQVALGYGNKPDWRCGATLIDPSYVITAAHCVRTAYGPPKVILLGDRRLSFKKDVSRMLVNVSEIYVHPKYKPPLQYNDIAIVKLATEVTLSRAILPACLPNPGDRLDRLIGMEAMGWGQTGAFDGQSDVLKSATLAKFDNEECTSFFRADGANKNRLPKGIIRSQFCAGDKHGLRDTCKGDSGGPVTVAKDASCVHYLVGITSFGSNLCGYQQPGVYTNVLAYLEWIEDVIWSNLSAKERSKLYTRVSSYDDDLIFNPSFGKASTTSTESTLTDSTTTTWLREPTMQASTTKTTPTTYSVLPVTHFSKSTVPSSATEGPFLTTEIKSTLPQINISPSAATQQFKTTIKYNFFNISGTISDLLHRISIGR